ncbi:hypothetical protein ANN_19711 [Periplaneta americana]|uniref:Uncharacterized protein n=1 Tax=Periplaneta americana TaxID=6978 RepID=A0ABQ8SBA5_PERAM|nr:hypothetical protein ANN_19711 [Periplaneta americana]
MAGLCEGGNEPAGSLKAIKLCSANDKSALYRYKTSANDKSALYRYKTSSIDYSRICNRKRISEKSRRLEIQHCRRRSMTFVPRKKSILSRLRTSHNLRDIAQGQFRSPPLKSLPEDLSSEKSQPRMNQQSFGLDESTLPLEHWRRQASYMEDPIWYCDTSDGGRA